MYYRGHTGVKILAISSQVLAAVASRGEAPGRAEGAKMKGESETGGAGGGTRKT
jgi:hypothetical protein